MSTTAAAEPPVDYRRRRFSTTRRATFAANYGSALLLVVLFIVAALLRPRFFSDASMRNTSRQAAVLGIVALGQSLVLLVRCVDLSVSAVIGFTVVLIAQSGGHPVRAIAVSCVIAVGVALVNGYLTTKRNVPPFIATFGMLVLLNGARAAYTKGSMSGRVPRDLVDLARMSLGPIPFPVAVWIGCTVVGALFIARTATGRRLVMTGANEEMSRLSGLPVDRYKVTAFLASSLLAVLAGTLLAGSTGYVDRFVGRNTELDSITAALLGGSSFAGGDGSILGAALGAALLASLFTLIVLLGWSPELQLVSKGVVLVAALAARGLLSRGTQS